MRRLLLCLVWWSVLAFAAGSACAAAAAPPAKPAPAAQATDPAPSVRLGQVRIQGVRGPAQDNVRLLLDLGQLPAGTPLTEARLQYLLRIAEEQVRTALQPFGYYAADVAIDAARRAGRVDLTVGIALGEPVRVGTRAIEVRGDAGSERAVQRRVQRFTPAVGAVFEHGRYTASKQAIERVLGERGYFDAELQQARVEVRPAERRADIELAWDSGVRHRFGDTRFHGSQILISRLQPLVPYRRGEPFHQRELLELHQALTDLDYFGLIDLQPQVDAIARVPGQAPVVPIDVHLTPAKRSVYRAGVLYGTDTGPALKLGFDRRWVNARGHKLQSDLELGQRRSTLAAQYRIPALAVLPGWWNTSLALRQEEIGGRDTEIADLAVARTARRGEDQYAAELHLQRERFDTGATTLVYPAVRWDRLHTDHPLYPRRGYSFGIGLRAGHSAIGSDVDFVQLSASARWVHRLDDTRRLIARGDFGRTRTTAFERLPPSLRFYAGGDRSVRGYGYQELAPRFGEAEDATGGENLLAGSIELEQMFTRRWGGAVFVDAGNAFSGDRFDPRVGVGIGLRWRSPVGPVRVDVAHGLDDPDRGLRLHLNIGPDL